MILKLTELFSHIKLNYFLCGYFTGNSLLPFVARAVLQVCAKTCCAGWPSEPSSSFAAGRASLMAAIGHTGAALLHVSM
jgi:hypothetical protein